MNSITKMMLSISLTLLFVGYCQSAEKVEQATIALCKHENSDEHSALERALEAHYYIEHTACSEAKQPSQRTYIAEGLANATDMLSNLSLAASQKIVVGLYQSEYDQLLAKYPSARNVVVVPRDPSPRSQLALAKSLFPSNSRLLLLYSKTSRHLLDLYRQHAATLGVEIVEGEVNSEADGLKIIKENTSIDAILAIPDQSIYNRYTIPVLLRTSYAFNIPMLGFSPRMVELGFLATTYAESETVHERVIASIQHWGVMVASTQLLDANALLKQLEESSAASISINRSVAQSLNLVIDENKTLERQVNSMKGLKRD